MEVNVIDLLTMMGVAISSIIVGTQTITAAIHGAFNITNKNVVHAVSWIVGTLAGLGFVMFNGLDFHLPTVWNYIVGGICGLFAGSCSNGIFDWPKVEKIFDAITALFGKKKE